MWVRGEAKLAKQQTLGCKQLILRNTSEFTFFLSPGVKSAYSNGGTCDEGSLDAMPSQPSCASATTQDVTTGDASEYEDSGIDGVTMDAEHRSRRYKTMSASFSVCLAGGTSMFAHSDSGAGKCVQGVYENFRQELEMSSCQTESLEEAGSALSDENSTMSSTYQSDPVLGIAQGMVRKAGRLAVKNFLVHKKSKKVESATRRKWKSYWVSLKGLLSLQRIYSLKLGPHLCFCWSFNEIIYLRSFVNTVCKILTAINV